MNFNFLFFNFHFFHFVFKEVWRRPKKAKEDWKTLKKTEKDWRRLENTEKDEEDWKRLQKTEKCWRRLKMLKKTEQYCRRVNKPKNEEDWTRLKKTALNLITILQNTKSLAKNQTKIEKHKNTKSPKMFENPQNIEIKKNRAKRLFFALRFPFRK